MLYPLCILFLLPKKTTFSLSLTRVNLVTKSLLLLVYLSVLSPDFSPSTGTHFLSLLVVAQLSSLCYQTSHQEDRRNYFYPTHQNTSRNHQKRSTQWTSTTPHDASCPPHDSHVKLCIPFFSSISLLFPLHTPVHLTSILPGTTS